MAFFITVLLLISFKVASQEMDEYTAKAVILKHFAEFIQWPDNYNNDANKECFVISVYGTDPFDGKLSKLYAHQQIQNKPVKVRYINDIHDIDSCNILFISHSAYKDLAEIYDYVKNMPILTVTDTRSFLDKGVQIYVYVENNRIRFQISENNIKETKLTIDFRLISYGKMNE